MKRKRPQKIRKTERGGFLNKSDFAYAGRHTVNIGLNTFNRLALRLMRIASNKINRVAERRIRQTVQQGKKEVERVAPKVIRNITEEVYEMPFHLLGNFGKKKYLHLKRKTSVLFKKSK